MPQRQHNGRCVYFRTSLFPKKEALRNELPLNEDGINWSHTDRMTNMWDHLWLMNLRHKTNQQGFNLIFKKGATVPLGMIKSSPPTKKSTFVPFLRIRKSPVGGLWLYFTPQYTKLLFHRLLHYPWNNILFTATEITAPLTTFACPRGLSGPWRSSKMSIEQATEMLKQKWHWPLNF